MTSEKPFQNADSARGCCVKHPVDGEMEDPRPDGVIERKTKRSPTDLIDAEWARIAVAAEAWAPVESGPARGGECDPLHDAHVWRRADVTQGFSALARRCTSGLTVRAADGPPRRRVIERILGWMIQWRGLERDYENASISDAMIHVAGTCPAAPDQPLSVVWKRLLEEHGFTGECFREECMPPLQLIR